MPNNRADDISLALVKAKRNGFLPDVLPGELETLEREATKIYENDVRQRLDGLSVGEGSMGRKEIITTAAAVTTQSVRLTHFTAQKSEMVTQIATITGGTAAGATPTLCKMGFYKIEDNGDATLLAQTANDTTLFSATVTRYVRPLNVPVLKERGQRYGLAILVVSAGAMPSFYGHTIGAAAVTFFLEPKLYSLQNGVSDLPASIPAGSMGGSNGFFMEILP